jgi:hypothetical protein
VPEGSGHGRAVVEEKNMILCLEQGEPSYVPDGLMGQARDHADVSYLAFLQCYARNLVNWEIICFFADHQEAWCAIRMLTEAIGCSGDAIVESLARLSEARLLDERVVSTGFVYRLTRAPQLRRQVARVGAEWHCQSSQIR